ncbi:peptidoglycan DD-metalloendopeptidase family protein [Desulfuribacillus alkaliarsenatis]|uniref:Peptidase M23 n=1 Tax=Desulfuribacillus alkaliarsenatis TaxID=766136 RepID=A0A1E5G499_9FIRM|nr:M23 family metallopeptidase [Desulfuribacillus alkaliarsenatis]OEF97834.1 hypothetical protein BHF68_13460 [Desulfuribacillus alkaliarsenatis]
MKMKRPHERKQHTDRKKAGKPSQQEISTLEKGNGTTRSKMYFMKIKENISEYVDKSKKYITSIDVTKLKEKASNTAAIVKDRLSKGAITLRNKLSDSFANAKQMDYQNLLRSKAFIITCVFLVAIIAVVGIGQQVKQAQIQHQLFLEENKTYKVFIDGAYIGNVSDTQIIEDHINNQLTDLMYAYDLEARLINEITYEEYFENEIEAQDSLVLNKTKNLLDFQTRSVMIYVNDNPVVRVASEQDAEEIIENVKQAYVSNSENSRVMVAEINDRVDYKVEWAQPSDIRDLESATAVLLRGTDKEIKHIVESGENIWVIAQKNKVTVSEIMDANPQLSSQSDIIRPGDELSLVVPEPFVNVEVVEEIQVVESIPFSTRNVNNNSMYTWESRVQTRGQPGEKEVVYRISKINGKEVEREIIEETIIKEPVEQVVARGTIGVPANGSGTLAWPTSGGRISSMFGGARRHTGVDIANPTGTPVYAADHGTVVFAGWNGGYGNLIRVAHTSSMQTYYAHLSSINVRVGQTVNKGEVIGRVGSTGQSTGPHLHFEVRLNGSPVNPMNYYGSTR